MKKWKRIDLVPSLIGLLFCIISESASHTLGILDTSEVKSAIKSSSHHIVDKLEQIVDALQYRNQKVNVKVFLY